jgi:ligand-binding sensor domain-containing protein/class 3 adenylate cyclase/predicted metal-dependent HD superfamily phosphohydrolase
LNKLIKILGVFILVVNIFYTYGQSTYRFKNYSIVDGLSQSSVTSIEQDKFGALWFGTQDGLNRFDGQTFENFTSDNTNGIENSYFKTSFKSKDGNLWFGTSNGLTQYNPTTESFKTFQLSGRFALQIETITDDSEGNLWIGTSANGLCIFSKKTQKFNFFISSIPSNKILFLKFLDKETLFVSTEDKGLFLVNTKTKKLIDVPIIGKQKQYVRINTIAKRNKNLWLIGTNQGLYQYNASTSKIIPFLTKMDKIFGLVEVVHIYIQNENQFFLSTKNTGLFTVFEKNNQSSIFQNTQDLFQNNALIYNSVNKVFKDKTGTFWVATERGIGSFNPFNKGFLGVEPSGDLSKGIPSPSVWCFSEDEKSRYIFVGTDNAISRKNLFTGKFDQFLRNKNSVNENAESSILSLHAINRNELLVGTSEGLYILKINSTYSYSFNKVKYKGIDNPSNFERTYSIAHWKANLYFLATKGGILLYDKSTGKFQSFEHNPLEPKKTIKDGVCRLVYKDNTGKIWFPTSLGGLNYLNEKNGLKIVPFENNNTITSLSKDYITTINHYSKDVYYFGTMGSGLIEYNVSTNIATLYNKKNGLPNNVVYGVLKDKKGHLWLSTNKGISKFSVKTKTFENYTELDGLVSTEFNQGAYFSSSTGDFYFGAINGFNYFDPLLFDNQQKKTNVVFTKFKLDAQWLKPNDEDGILTQSFSETKRIDLNYKQRNFTIKFMATDLSNPRLVTYKYDLIGSDEGEIIIGNSNQIHFNSLDPGEYVLKVYARLGNGEWSTIPAEVEIYLAAPFWKRTWFWITVIFFVGIFVLAITRRKIEVERRQQVKLEMKIVERTREIREQNIKIEKQKQTIEEKKNHLEEQKKLLEIEKEKTEKLLRNIIPESTMNELKTKGKASARAYKTVSVMFTDFVGFTKIAEKMSPSDLVNELDIYFSKFDEIIVQNNLEKIKTIGDAYMCAGGVPVRNNTNPIDACIAALQIQESMEIMRREAESTGRIVWDLRLGINTGEVTAGVIGSEKLAYDIWGATVNQAQRMEMLGEPGKVTISGQTFQYIEPYFLCSFKGKVKSKSKGLIDMYTVEGIKPELSVDGKGLYPNDRFNQIVNLHHYSSINYYKAERHIMKVLEKKLSPKLHYHSISHTKDVCRAVERLALLEGVADEGLFLLKSAATYHDAGFVESYDKNEPVGARMAGEILPKYGYTEEHIEEIRRLIYVTQIPHKPTNKLEEIICDADLDYLGRDDFHQIADKLRQELREHGKIDSDRKWDEIQVMFLNQHQYFTETAKATRQEKKMRNLEEIKARLERNEYAD